MNEKRIACPARDLEAYTFWPETTVTCQGVYEEYQFAYRNFQIDGIIWSV